MERVASAVSTFFAFSGGAAICRMSACTKVTDCVLSYCNTSFAALFSGAKRSNSASVLDLPHVTDILGFVSISFRRVLGGRLSVNLVGDVPSIK